MIDDYQPALVCIVETHMQKEEEIQIPGYSLLYCNDRSANSGGILIGVRDNIKNISLELTHKNKVGQSLWILLTNTKKKIRIGVIYAPQENVTPNNELKLMYEDIREQIKIGKEEKQQILIIGDFNAKIGEAIEGNKTQVTTGGRQLLKLANKENMIILNTVKETCKGVWTRVQGEEKSITDYVLTDASSANTVKEMKIDEEKQYGLHKLYKNTATNENRKIYSDHNSILINLDFDTPTEEERPKKIITKEGYKRYRTIIKEENVSELLKLGDLQESCNKWSIAIENSIKTVQKTRTKNPRKDIKELQKIRKRLREEFSTTKELHEKILILERIKTSKGHITEKFKEVRSKRINRIAQEIRENVDNGGKIWEVKRRLEKKVQTPYSITNAEGIKLQNRLDIQEEYKNIWPAEQRINYSSLMLYHNRLVKQIILEQRAQNYSKTFYDKVRTIAEELNTKLERAVIMKKSDWKRTVKDKIQNQIQERVEKEIENKTKLRTVQEDKWERKEYITTCDSDLVKDIIKIRLHMWELKKNYPREEEDTKCPICNQKEDTTEYVLECQRTETVYKIKDNNTPNQWAEVVKLYRQNKKQRK